ncbi:MAG: dihydrofolate reductase [Elusimicrobia bacterium]|nr:dihydrofolate reductase [Elusimicrobiota bacterium]
MRASAYIGTSLDGFIARANGDIDWLPDGSGGEDWGYKAFFKSVDALVIGRKSFEKVLSFKKWPYGNKPVVVLSRRRLTIPKRIAQTVESSSSSPAKLVRQLSQRGFKHVYVDGGKTIQGFLNAGLIQEITITKLPILIGKGIPLFGPTQHDIKLRHLGTKQFANGFVQSKYQVLR